MIFEKPFRHVDTVFIHCSASDNPDHDDVSVIREWHLARGWHDVGYHYFIKKDGTIQLGRDLEQIPAAQQGYNEGSIAICLHGLEKSKFTEAQFDSLRDLCGQINSAYGGTIRFRGHNEVSAKACPVFDYRDVLDLDDEGYMEGAETPVAPSGDGVAYRFTRIEELAGTLPQDATAEAIAMHARVGRNLYNAEKA